MMKINKKILAAAIFAVVIIGGLILLNKDTIMQGSDPQLATSTASTTGGLSSSPSYGGASNIAQDTVLCGKNFKAVHLYIGDVDIIKRIAELATIENDKTISTGKEALLCDLLKNIPENTKLETAVGSFMSEEQRTQGRTMYRVTVHREFLVDPAENIIYRTSSLDGSILGVYGTLR